MRTTATACCFLLSVFTLLACNNEQDTRKHIQQDEALLAKKKQELADLNYKVTHNSLRVGTNDYDSTIGRDFNVISAAMQASIDSLQTETDSLKMLLPK